MPRPERYGDCRRGQNWRRRPTVEYMRLYVIHISEGVGICGRLLATRTSAEMRNSFQQTEGGEEHCPVFTWCMEGDWIRENIRATKHSHPKSSPVARMSPPSSQSRDAAHTFQLAW